MVGKEGTTGHGTPHQSALDYDSLNEHLISSLKYILGIVEKGTGQEPLGHISIKQQVLGYVMFLEQELYALRAENERLRKAIDDRRE
jgi:hypothetical protein